MDKVCDSIRPSTVRVPEPTPPTTQPLAQDDMVIRSFLFSPTDIATLKRNLSPAAKRVATTYEVLAAAVWSARTAAITLPGEDAMLVLVDNFRRNAALRLPPGYYGNACAPLRAVASAGVLTGGGSLDVVVELVQKAKATAGDVRSLDDLLRLHEPPTVAGANIFLLSDLRHLGWRVDYGWGEPLYGGVSEATYWGTGLAAVKNSDREDEVALPIVLPRPAMQRFETEMNKLLRA